MKKISNLYIGSSYGLSFLLVLTPLILSLGMIFDSTMNFSSDVLYLYIPPFVYYLYIHFVIRNYYKKKLDKRIEKLVKKTITIDKMLGKKVEMTNFNYLGLGANVSEYFFIIYNEKYNKYFRISSVRNSPNYIDEYISKWEGKKITIYIDPQELENKKKGNIVKKNKNTLWVFRFQFEKFNLENNYKYSISEDIARKGLFEGYLLLFSFFSICLYAHISFIEYMIK